MSAVALLGLGAEGLQSEIDGFLLRAPKPSSSQIADFLKLYSAGETRNDAARALIARGIDPNTVASALNWLATSGQWTMSQIKGVMTVVAAAAAGFHGYRRNKGSIGWTVAWFVFGGVFPIFSTVVALAQGFGKAKS